MTHQPPQSCEDRDACDKDSIRLVLGWESAAFEDIVRRYSRMIFGLSYRMLGSREDAVGTMNGPRPFLFRFLLFPGIVALAPTAATHAQSTVMQLGTTVEGLSFSDENDDVYFPVFGIDASFARRSALESGGFLLLRAGVGFDYAGQPLADFRDREFADIEAELPLGTNRVAIEAQLDSSLYSFGAGPRLEPAWSVRYRFTAPRRRPEPWVGYLGSAVYDSDSDESRLESGASVGLPQRPSVRLGYSVAAEAVAGWWYDQPLYRAGGTSGSAYRRDLLLRSVVSGDGLVGYFAEWDALFAAGYRLSSANRYLEVDDVIQYGSEDRVELESAAGFSYSPTRNVALRLALGAKVAIYPNRSVPEADGSASADTLRWYDLSAEAGLDLKPNDTVYLTFALAGSTRLSNDSELRRRAIGASLTVTRVLR